MSIAHSKSKWSSRKILIPLHAILIPNFLMATMINAYTFHGDAMIYVIIRLLLSVSVHIGEKLQKVDQIIDYRRERGFKAVVEAVG